MNAAVLALSLLAQLQVRDSPKDWRLLTTEHFNLYYPSDELLPRARQFAAWFEEGRTMLIGKTGTEPRRVNVYLYKSFHDLLQSSFIGQFQTRDSQSLSQQIRRSVLGSGPPDSDAGIRASPFCRPNARSRALALAEPTRDRIFIHCQPSDRWNAWFARHELAHQVQFAGSFPFTTPSWLIALRNPITPIWWWEGGADYLAGIFDSSKDAWVRDLASERLYTLKELYSSDALNPYDSQAPYYEGSYFWRFLDEKYGAGTGRKVFEAYIRGIPMPMQAPLRTATGLSREELERDFAEHLRAGWAPKMEGRAAPTDRLTDSRAYYRRRAWGGRWSPDGSHLAWSGDSDSWPELYVDGRGILGWKRGLNAGWIASAPSWSPDGQRIAIIEWTTNRDTLLIVDLEGRYERIELPQFDELYDPAWAPDGDRIAFAALKNGTSDLYTLRLSDRKIERLTEDADADSGPAWSRDGRLAWIKETDGRTFLHVAGKGPVTKSWALMEYPQWSPDGKSIVVAADIGGVYDAFAVDPATGKAKRLTKVTGGVSYPAYHPDGSLVITYFEGRGQDLYRVRAEPQDEPAFDQEERKRWYEQFRKPPPQGEPAEKSRVWGVDWLMFPVGSSSWVVPGFEFQFGDRDAENTFTGGALAIPGLWQATATVANRRWRPTLGVTGTLAHERDLSENQVEAFANVPLNTLLSVGTGWIARETDDRDADFSFVDSGPTASLRFSNEMSYRNLDPTWGFAFGATASFFDERFGGERDLREYFGFFEASRDVAHDWILWSRVTYEKLSGREFLADEVLELEDAVRGAEDLFGLERGVASLELRFPIWRDMLWEPLELVGLGEFLLIKDLRGFAFGQAGYTGLEFSDIMDRHRGAVSAGVGLRLDLAFMLWPFVNFRVPIRVEVWTAIVGQSERAPDPATGFALQIGF